jgi:hypothetical protein
LIFIARNFISDTLGSHLILRNNIYRAKRQFQRSMGTIQVCGEANYRDISGHHEMSYFVFINSRAAN